MLNAIGEDEKDGIYGTHFVASVNPLLDLPNDPVSCADDSRRLLAEKEYNETHSERVPDSEPQQRIACTTVDSVSSEDQSPLRDPLGFVPISAKICESTEAEIELIPGGSRIPVTSANREKFVQLFISHALSGHRSQQVERYHRGFKAVVRRDIVEQVNFNSRIVGGNCNASFGRALGMCNYAEVVILF